MSNSIYTNNEQNNNAKQDLSASSSQQMQAAHQKMASTSGKQHVLNGLASANNAQYSLLNNNNNQHQHPPNQYRTIISNSRIHILENASLVIRDVSRQDSAFYLCQAANNFGSLSALIKLTVNGK